MAEKLKHIRSILSHQFKPYVMEIFFDYCYEEQYEETNIEEDIEEPKDSIIYEHMQSTLQWTDFQTNHFIQALQIAIHSETVHQNVNTDSDDDIDDIYASSPDEPSTNNKSHELQSILDMLSSSYTAHIIEIFSRFCQEQEYLDKSTILEDIEEDDGSFIVEHMQLKCDWNKSNSQAFIRTLHRILNGETIHNNSNMLYRKAIHSQFGIHPLLDAFFNTLITPITPRNTHHIVMNNAYTKYSNNNINPIQDYTNVDVETRARISLRQTMKKQFENGTFHDHNCNQMKPWPQLLDDIHDFEDDAYDDWNINSCSVTDVAYNNHDDLATLAYNNRYHNNVDNMVGLRNMGATCYMNAVLQALYCSDIYRDFLLNQVVELKYDPKYAKKYKMPKQPLHELQKRYTLQQKATIELKNVLRNLHDKESHIIHTRDLMSVLPKRWHPGKQQDSNEFAKFILNCIWETIDQSSIMKDVYDKTEFSYTEIYQLKQLRLDPHSHGMLNYTTKCMQCGCKSAKFEAFFDLALALSHHMHKKECKLSTKELIEDHMKEEQLTKDNAYYCNKCRQNVEAVRYIAIVRPPKLLLLCFKRYLLNTHTNMREKIMTNVDCPILLQIERDIYDSQNHEKVTYILYAVVMHHGLNAQFGHYYTIGRHSEEALQCHKNSILVSDEHAQMQLEEGKWFRFDDERVTKSSYQQLRSLPVHDTPYMLFYVRVKDE